MTIKKQENRQQLSLNLQSKTLKAIYDKVEPEYVIEKGQKWP